MASKHEGSFTIVWRNDDNTKRTWRAKCNCKFGVWEGPEYEVVEDEWRKHVHAATGKAPKPCGNKAGRWEP
jgi:hypothetical protein